MVGSIRWYAVPFDPIFDISLLTSHNKMEKGGSHSPVRICKICTTTVCQICKID